MFSYLPTHKYCWDLSSIAEYYIYCADKGDSNYFLTFYLATLSIVTSSVRQWLGGSVHSIKKNTEALVDASNEVGIDVNANKTKNMVTSRDQNAGRSHNIKTGNSSFARVEEFLYLGKTLMIQNSIQEEIRSRLKAGNACYQSVQNLSSSSLLSKNIKLKTYRTTILPVVLYGCETW